MKMDVENGGAPASGAKGAACDSGKLLPPPPQSHKCRDCACAVLFLAYWVGMVAVAAIGFTYGDGLRLIYGTDYMGNTCGSSSGCGSSGCGSRIYYPRQDMDALLQGYSPTAGNPLDIKLFGVCVDRCPARNEFVCTYAVEEELAALGAETRASTLRQCAAQVQSSNLGFLNQFGLNSPTVSADCSKYMSNCWLVMARQEEIFWRCLNNPVLSKTSTQTCAYPKYQNATSLRMPVQVCSANERDELLAEQCEESQCSGACVKNVRCAYVEVNSTESTSGSSQSSPLAEQLTTWSARIKRSVGDLQQTWYVIVVIGILASALLGYGWLVLLKWTIKFFVWMSILLSLLFMVLGTLFCFFKAGKVDSGWLVDAVSTASDSSDAAAVTSAVTGVAAEHQGWWEFAGIVSAIASGVYFLIIVVMRRKIKIAIAILCEASYAVRGLKAALLVPAWTFCCSVILIAYFAVVSSYVATAGNLESSTITLDGLVSGTQSAVNSIANATRLRNLADLDATDSALQSGAGVALTEVTHYAGVEGLLLYHFLGFLWSFQFILGVSTTTVAGAVCQWYWTPKEQRSGLIPVAASFRRAVTVHFGTIAFGSLLIAIVQLVRAIVAYIDRRLKKLKDQNQMVKIILCLVKCCLWCFEQFLKYVSRMAYIYAAMMGTSFCPSAKAAVSVLLDNIGRVAAVHFISGFVFTLSKVVITVAAVLLAWVWLEHDSNFQIGGERAISSETLPMVFTGVIAFGIATGFMHVYGIAVDTILLCFCVDVKSRPYYMGETLKKFFKDRQKAKKRRKQKGSNSAAVQPSQKSATVTPAVVKS